MKCHPINVRYEACATCAKIGSCSVFAGLTTKQREAYIEVILDHVARHPDKYELGVVMAETKPQKNIVMLDEEPGDWKSMEDINEMSDEEKLKLRDKTIYQVAKRYEVRYRVELKAVPLTTEKPSAGRKQKK